MEAAQHRVLLAGVPRLPSRVRLVHDASIRQSPSSTEFTFSQIRGAFGFAILLIQLRLIGEWRDKMEPLAQSSEARFADYVDALTTVMGRGDRAGPLKDYCVGLLMPGERKSVEPMAAVVAPARVSAKHQSLLHLVGQGAWSDEAVLAKVRELVLPAIEAQGKMEAWIVDDTGFAKKGVHSVGVARQYCGRLGKTDNCQIAVTLSIANHAASLPIAYQLYPPEDWALDEARREKARVPDEVTFRTKPEIALAQIGTALAAGVAPGVLLADARYGADGAFRSGVTASGLAYRLLKNSFPSRFDSRSDLVSILVCSQFFRPNLTFSTPC